MPLINLILIVYALFLIVGAFFGWKAGSQVSLIMGIVSGLLVLCGVYYSGSHPAGGMIFIRIFLGFLAVVFSIRLIKTKKIMPAGMLLGLTAGIFLLTLIIH